MNRFSNVFPIVLALVLALSALSVTPVSAGWLKITKPERSGPLRLVCLNPDGLMEHVNRLTRNQLFGLYAAARSGEIKHPCDDVKLLVGTRWTGHSRWLQTADGWWVLGLTIVYPNDIRVVTVDPEQAVYGQKPPEFRLRYVIRGDGIFEVVP